MGVSKAIHACQGSNNHGIFIMIYKHQKHAINNKHEKHANVNKE